MTIYRESFFFIYNVICAPTPVFAYLYSNCLNFGSQYHLVYNVILG